MVVKGKLFLILFCLVSSPGIHCQTQKEIQFIQDVLPQLIDGKFKYILVYENANKPLLASLEVERGEYLSSLEIQEFAEKIKQTKPSIKWGKKMLRKAKILSNSDRYKQHKKIVKDWEMAFKRFYKYYNLTELEYENEIFSPINRDFVPSDFRKLRREEQHIFHIGIPIFLDNNQFALISFGIDKGPLNGIGWDCLFENSYEKWLLKVKFETWAS